VVFDSEVREKSVFVWCDVVFKGEDVAPRLSSSSWNVERQGCHVSRRGVTFGASEGLLRSCHA
jgi:hypothetical protein